MEGVEKIDKGGMYGAEREINGIEYRITEGLRSRGEEDEKNRPVETEEERI